MENLTDINYESLEMINGGISAAEAALGIAGCFYPPLGVVMAVKGASDWLDEQPW